MTREHQAITLTVNGQTHQLFVDNAALLLNVLRDQLYLTGAKYGCGIGECGACSVLIDGELTLSCMTLAQTAVGHEITTVEAVAESPAGQALTKSFLAHAAVQCGFCTPGMLVASSVLVQEVFSPTTTQIREHLRGNLCRCTGYAALVEAVQSAAAELHPTAKPRPHAG